MSWNTKTSSVNCTQHAHYGNVARTRLGRHFMATASASVISIMFSTAAQAQFLPAGCTPSPATPGDTVICEGTINSTVATNVDDITIVIGDGIIPTTVTDSSGTAVNVTNSTASGDISVTVSEGSSVTGYSGGIYLSNSGNGSATITAFDSSDAGTYGNGITAYGSFNTTDMTVTSTSTATGGQSGIVVRHDGSGNTSVTAVDTSGATNDGINAYGGYQSANMSVTSTGTAAGGQNGLYVRHNGTGSLTVATADSTGTNNSGLDVYGGFSTTSMNVTSTGTLAGAINGIAAHNRGTGSLIINAADSSGTNGYGIYAFAEQMDNGVASTTDLIVTSSGTSTGGISGIRVVNQGSGITSVTAVDSIGLNGAGIDVYGDTSTTDLSVTSTGTVTGAQYGIVTQNLGNGTTNIDVNIVTGGTNGINSNSDIGATTITLGPMAVVTGQTAAGIYARSENALADITVQGSSGDVVGGTDGINIETLGGADILVDNLDSVVGQAGDGVDVTSNGGAITINAVDTIFGIGAPGAQGNGILAVSAGGDISVQGSGLVGGIEGATGRGIDANAVGANGLLGGNVNLGGAAALGDVTGSQEGILATTTGAGNITINTSAGMVSGGSIGVSANSMGTGEISITSANVTGTTDTGIFAANNADSTGSITIDSAGGTVTGGTDGIEVQNLGIGAVSITTADVTGINGEGIVADLVNAASSGDLTINSTAGSVTSNTNNGIVGINRGAGAVSVTTADVTAVNGVGIGAISDTGDVTVDSTAGTIIGGQTGIVAYTGIANAIGTGALSVTTADVTGTNADGITAIIGAAASTGDLNVDSSAGAITGGLSGINASNLGTGNTTVNVDFVTGVTTGISSSSTTGTTTITLGPTSVVTGQTAEGILANSTGALADITVQGSSGDVEGDTDGINIVTNGANIIVENLDSVTGNAGDGIDLMSNGGAITISAVDAILGTGGNGILAGSGGGNISVQGSGLVGGIEGTAGRGIDANASGAPGIPGGNVDLGGVAALGDVIGSQEGIYAATNGVGNITVDTSSGTVSGGSTGINANNVGTGGIDITTADVSGATGRGILASLSNVAGTSDLTIDSSAGSVTGNSDGIRASNSGTGAISVTSANVTGTNGIGIVTFSYDGDATVDSRAGAVTGRDYGIGAIGFGSGSVSVTSADVTGDTLSGIYASSTGGDVTVDSGAGTVMGAFRGINARGLGAVSVTAANVIGTYGNGISAGSTDGNVTVNSSAGVVIGGQDGDGIDANAAGTVTITSADVSGGQRGITAVSDGGGVAVDSSAGAVTGGTDGIYAVNNGTGATTVSANTASAATGNGIWVSGGANGGPVSITTSGNVNAGMTGIYANAGSGDLSLSIGGDVNGGDNGIVTVTQNGTDLTVAAGQTISGGATGIATMATGASATSNDTINILGTVNGAIQMFEGDDSLTLGTGSTVNGAIRGGDGTDTLNFNNGSGTINNSGAATDGIAEFEIYNFNGGDFILNGVQSGLTATNFNAGNNIIFGTLQSNSVLNAFGASLQVADGAFIEGDLTNDGRLAINSGGTGTFAVNGDFTQTGQGVITLGRTGVDTRDQLVVSGDVNLAGTLNLNQTAFFNDTITLIDGTTGLNGTFDTVTGLLSDGLLFSQAIEYDLAAFDVNLVTSVTNAKSIVGLSPNQGEIANALTTELVAGTIGDGTSGGLDTIVTNLGGIDDVSQLAQSLEEFSPEIVDTGLQVFQNSQLLHMMSLLDMSGDRDSANCVVKTVSLYDAFSLGRQKSAPQMWGSFQYSSFDQDGGTNNLDSKTDGYEINTGVNGLSLGAAKIGVTAGFAEYITDSGLSGNAGQDQVKTQIFRIAAHGAIGLNEGGRGLNSRVDGAVGFATGTNDIDQTVNVPSISLTARQTADPGLDSLTAMARFSIDGQNGNEWAIKPYILAAVVTTRQDAFRLGRGVTAVNVEKVKADRQTLGFGARWDHKFSDEITMQLDATGMHHLGGTQADLVSNFEAAGANATNFNVAGKEIDTQYLIQGTLGYKMDSGLQAGIGAFGEFGDLEGYGGRVTIAKSF